MEGNPLVSVIINCYNGEKYLRETIDSVMVQTYKNWEIVFWDNQSTDSSREIVESYKSEKIHYYYAPTHTDLGEARNNAVKVASGLFVAFLDCDDLWYKEKLAMQISMVDNKTELAFTPFDILCEDYASKFLQTMRIAQQKCINFMGCKQNFYKILLEGNFMCVSSLLLSKELFLKVGGIDSTIRHNADYDLLLKTSLVTNFACTSKPGIRYRIHPLNMSNDSYLYGFYENREIYNRCPKSKELNNAIKANETHIILHESFGKINIIKILLLIIQKGSFSELYKTICRRFSRMKF